MLKLIARLVRLFNDFVQLEIRYNVLDLEGKVVQTFEALLSIDDAFEWNEVNRNSD